MTELAGLADPAAVVVAAVTEVVPGLDPGMIRAAVEDSGGRARRRRLAAALAADPSVLTTGRSPAPAVIAGLLLALRAAGAAVSMPRCAACDQEITSVQRHGQDWYCAVCVRRLSLRTCAACGRERPAASRERSGQPRCERCPDRDDRDPVTVIAAVITGLDPSLPDGAAADAACRVFTRQGDLRHLAWMVESKPGCLPATARRRPPVGAAADRRAERRRGGGDRAAGLPALPPGHPPAPARAGAMELPQLCR